MKRRSRPSDRNYDYDRDFRRDYENSSDSPTQGQRQSKTFTPALTATSIAILGGIFVLGIGVGIGISSASNTGPASNVFSRESIDLNAPNAELCVQFGASAIAIDTRVFVTLNPFNAYVAQPTMRPGCVIRNANWALLEQRKVVNSDQVRECRNRMNTFGFIGELENSPQVECVYQNDAAKNLFINKPGAGAPPPETERF